MTKIDKSQRATLIPVKENAVPLKNKVPYDQLRPYVTSELHEDTPPCTNDSEPFPNDLASSTNDSEPFPNDLASSINDPEPFPNNLAASTNDLESFSNNPATSTNDQDLPPLSDVTPPCNIDKPPSSIKHGSKIKYLAKPRKTLYCVANTKPEKLVSTILRKNYWLTDKHIDHAQWLISRQFPHVKGLHSVLAFESNPPKVDSGLADLVQILNIGHNHWAVATNIGCKENTIKVYGTLYRNMGASDKVKLAALLKTSMANMVIEWPALQLQEGDSDCGLFAIAIAMTLASGLDPSRQNYDQSVMREHLTLCIQCDD